jgi:hypothetical protein
MNCDKRKAGMGYEIQLQAKILALLQIFHDNAPDRETHALVTKLISDKTKWPDAHDLFGLIRRRCLVLTKDTGRATMPEGPGELAKVYQYSFEELCLKAIYNETDTNAPFDPDSPFWIAGSAIKLARKLGMTAAPVVAVIAPEV